jgi:putative metal-binding protein
MAGRCRFIMGLCVTAVLLPAATADAQAPVPCTNIGSGRYQCYWYVPGDGRTGGALVVRDRTTVGYLHQGYNWIVCQQQGGDMRNVAGDRNHWYGWTLADYNGQWGWASALEARGGDDYGPFSGVPNCNGAYGNPPLWSGTWGQPPPASAPPPPPGSPAPVDRDRDGVLPPLDCDDRNAAHRPGATDVPGNGVDENCDGADSPLPAGAPPARLIATVANFWEAGTRVTRLVRMRVRDAPPGATVAVSCLARRCALRRRTVATGANGEASLMPMFRRHRLRVGTVVEIRISYPNTIGKVLRYKTRPRRLPKVRVLCLPPGAAKPAGC